MQNTKEKDRTYRSWLPELAAVLLLAVQRVIAVSIYGLTLTGDTSLYELAKIAGADGVDRLPHTASYVYTCILSAFLRFLGNKWAVDAMLQAVLLFGVSLLFFYIVKRVYGKKAALAFLLLSAVIPDFWIGYQRLTPDILLVLYCGILLLLYISLLPDVEKKSSLLCGLAGIAVGIMSGILIWLDIIGLVFLFAFMAALCLLHRKQTFLQKSLSICGIALGAVSALSGSYLIELAAHLSDTADNRTAVITADALLEAAEKNIALYAGWQQIAALKLQDWIVLLAALLMCILLLLSVFGSVSIHTEVTCIIMLVLCGSVWVHGNYMTYVSYNWTMLTFSLLACCGALQYVLALCDKKKKQAVHADCVQMENTQSTQMDIKTDLAEKEQKQVQTVNYIPNPLPLPKKHEKKEMKFDLELLPEQLEFDHELKEGEEDYDIL